MGKDADESEMRNARWNRTDRPPSLFHSLRRSSENGTRYGDFIGGLCTN